jgi:hypothetical protein
MLVKNVTTTGDNAANKTIQVQFDMSWDNSWRDAINWDAAWVFMKYKDANGLWQHVQLNTTGFASGNGTENTIQVGGDKVGAFVYRSAAGTGTFASTTMQLQWNYGLSGLTSVTGLEVRVFAIEMVYVPQGDFTIRNDITKGFFRNYCYVDPNTGSEDYSCRSYESESYYLRPLDIYTATAVINSRLSPTFSYYDPQNNWQPISIKIKGNLGIDYNNDGLVENSNYPTGFLPFYCYKYEMSEQQYADFLNTLTTSQITGLRIGGSTISLSNGQYVTSEPDKVLDRTSGCNFCYSNMSERTFVEYLNGFTPTEIARVGAAGFNIFISNGQYYSSTPNRACGNGNAFRMLSYADWSGLRPMTFLEFNKASNGPLMPNDLNSSSNTYFTSYDFKNVGALATSSTSTSKQSGGSYYGIMDLKGNVYEPLVRLNYNSFTNANGNGVIGTNGESNVNNWNYDQTTTSGMINFCNITDGIYYYNNSSSKYPTCYGFRYVRSAE